MIEIVALLAPLALTGAQGSPPSSGAPTEDAPRAWKIFAERVWVEPGEALDNVLLLVKDGKLQALAPGRTAPDDDPDLLLASCVTAGMIDASVRIHTGATSVEQSKEITPDKRAIDGVDLFDYRWDRQAKSGVTTAQVAPWDRNVIGGRTVVLKTAGPQSMAARVLKNDAALRGAMGSLPSSGNRFWGRPTDFYQRRPTTRMGVEWEWRKAFYDAALAGDDPARAFAGSDVLQSVLRGELPLFIEAWATQDIRTAVFLKEELQAEKFGDINLIIDAGAEAWLEPQLLVRSSTAVVLPPFPHRGRTNDGAFMAWNTPRLLVDQGVEIALSSHGAKEPAERLAMQAAYAMRGGLTFDEALAAVTINPARMLGVDDRVGSVQAGKDADLVLWNGTPFDATARVIGVLVNGDLVLDPR